MRTPLCRFLQNASQLCCRWPDALASPGLYRGIDSKLAQTVLAAAILFTTKEKLTSATRSALRRASRGAKAA